ncbi:MAG: hypothetical protein CVT90_01920 [Candidatus Altiarchaeales archaeon HGW-Altiarchaeales-3]|nr:MAG: hypothetical protein CVT90_01920 [Candidatus Altiarchaeales archaeon HGW-Altiarchaeales-3]
MTNDEFYVLDMEMKTISPVISGEIKTSERDFKRKKDINAPCRITGDNKVAVPIYGVVRGYLERILREKGENVCDTGAKGAKGCGRCILCDLFGNLGRRGRVFFDDLKSNEDFNKVVKVSFHSRISRDDASVSDSLTIEEIQEDALFEGKIRILNPKEKDIELLSASIEAINEFGLGGWIRRGRGRVDMKIKSVSKRKWSEFYERGKEVAAKIMV